MATEELPPVDEESLLDVLAMLREVRAWAVQHQSDPWAFRQAMIIVIDIDTVCALEGGIEVKALRNFDVAANEKAREFIESMPEEARARGR